MIRVFALPLLCLVFLALALAAGPGSPASGLERMERIAVGAIAYSAAEPEPCCPGFGHDQAEHTLDCATSCATMTSALLEPALLPARDQKRMRLLPNWMSIGTEI